MSVVLSYDDLEEKRKDIYSLYDEFYKDSSILTMVAIFSDELEVEEMRFLLSGKPDVLDLQKRILNAFCSTQDARYLHVFNEYAIRANRENRENKEEVLLLPNEIYEEFTRLRDNCPNFYNEKLFPLYFPQATSTYLKLLIKNQNILANPL